uniref:Uncharacterized protein n=1 Tax=Brugia malayi TaxID=6279 RepID=A8Q6X1_BRUMA
MHFKHNMYSNVNFRIGKIMISIQEPPKVTMTTKH